MSPDNLDSERPVNEPDRQAPPRTPGATPPEAEPPAETPRTPPRRADATGWGRAGRVPLVGVPELAGAEVRRAASPAARRGHGAGLGARAGRAGCPARAALGRARAGHSGAQDRRGAIYADPQPEQPIAADGWFSLLGLAFGLLVALALWLVLRRRRGPVGLVAAVLGALVAAPVAWQVGRRIGLATFDRLLADAPAGQAFTKPADLRAGGVDWLLGVLPVPHGNLLLPAFGAAVMYTLLAGWSRWPGCAGARPGGVQLGVGGDASSANGTGTART
ncbi:DUF2567 domain-containing protein [Micromonospora sp. M12]